MTVTKQDELLTLDCPSRMPLASVLPDIVIKGMGHESLAVLKARNYVLVYDSEETVRALQPVRAHPDLTNLDPDGIIATAKGDVVDFVSRFFTLYTSGQPFRRPCNRFCPLLPHPLPEPAAQYKADDCTSGIQQKR